MPDDNRPNPERTVDERVAAEHAEMSAIERQVVNLYRQSRNDVALLFRDLVERDSTPMWLAQLLDVRIRRASSDPNMVSDLLRDILIAVDRTGFFVHVMTLLRAARVEGRLPETVVMDYDPGDILEAFGDDWADWPALLPMSHSAWRDASADGS